MFLIGGAVSYKIIMHTIHKIEINDELNKNINLNLKIR